jgi:hypothetical protein
MRVLQISVARKAAFAVRSHYMLVGDISMLADNTMI